MTYFAFDKCVKYNFDKRVLIQHFICWSICLQFHGTLVAPTEQVCLLITHKLKYNEISFTHNINVSCSIIHIELKKD